MVTTDPAGWEDLATLLGPYLASQRWFAVSGDPPADGPPGTARVVDAEVLRAGNPRLVWLAVEASGARWQVLIGLRPETEGTGVITGHDAAVLGLIDDPELGHAVAYDAVIDAELCLGLLGLVTTGQQSASRCRPVGAEQSNTSLVYDDRLILKIYRRLRAGPNPDVEVILALDGVGFNHVAAPVATWRRGQYDLALAQEFLGGATDGWALALTSLRDLYGSASHTGQIPAVPPGGPSAYADWDASRGEPAEGGIEGALLTRLVTAAGGDFGAEARRLGAMTAKMHLALAQAFGTQVAVPEQWADGIAAQIRALDDQVLDDQALVQLPVSGRAAGLLDRLRSVAHPGASIRAHGDYHLGQVMRGEVGWYVLDFEGEPARPLAERRRFTSPLRDVAGMLRSFQYATAVAASERGSAESPDLADLGGAWEERNRTAFLQGYLSAPGLDELVPADPAELQAVLGAFELEKAVYEVGYELAYRPGWVAIPLAALERLVGS